MIFYAHQNVDPECVYDSFSISWQYETHTVSLENSEIPRPQEDLEAVGANIYIEPKGVEEDYPLSAHTRNFLDCVKSRNRKTNASMEIGYNSALPCLLAVEAMQQNRVLGGMRSRERRSRSDSCQRAERRFN